MNDINIKKIHPEPPSLVPLKDKEDEIELQNHDTKNEYTVTFELENASMVHYRKNAPARISL